MRSLTGPRTPASSAGSWMSKSNPSRAIQTPSSSSDRDPAYTVQCRSSTGSTRHDVGVKRDLAVTISIGMATHNDGRCFRSVDEFVKAADKALYTAKLQGRNRSVPFDLVASSQLAYM